MFTARHKILKPQGAEPDALEQSVAQALSDLELNVPDLKAELRPLYITGVKEVDVGGGRKAVVVSIPVPLLNPFRKVQARLIRELEKKFSGWHVLILAQRRILPKPSRGSRQKQPRPRSRTLTSVHNNMLEDLVFPTEIVGRRMRVTVDGSKTYKVLLDKRDQNNTEYKLDTFAAVYKKLTGKNVVFEFPEYQTD